MRLTTRLGKVRQIGCSLREASVYISVLLQLFVWMEDSTSTLLHWMVSATENVMTCFWILEKMKYKMK